MKLRVSFLPLLVAIALLVGQMPAPNALAMQTTQTRAQLRTAYERGYVAGYTDGFRAGKDDYTNQFSRNFRQHLLYVEANRGYQSRYGAYSEYQRGYRLGFEVAYADGYSGRAFDSKIPSNVSRTARNRDLTESRRATNEPIVPDGMSLRIRLETPLATKLNHKDDPFDASVVEPREYQGAIIQGHIARIEHAGQITGRTLMALEFDTIILPNGGQGSLHAQIVNVYATDAVQSVDEEGNVVSASKTTETEIRSIGGAVLGAIVGGLVSGGTGIAIGAILGAGAGAGSVYVQGNKDLILNPGTQMMVRVSNPAQS